MADHGLEVLQDYVQHGDFFLPSGHRAMKTLLALDRRPTAVFVASDQMAVGAVQAITDAGLDVPGTSRSSGSTTSRRPRWSGRG